MKNKPDYSEITEAVCGIVFVVWLLWLVVTVI